MDNLDLMRERLAADKTEQEDFAISNLELMRKRICGGNTQQERMVKDKRETLERAIKYSYQGAKVLAVGDIEPAAALINPNAVKQDYDDKVISIDFDYNYSVGTVFDWLNTGTKWLIYLQDLTELAYFKGDIRKCNYEIKWKVEGQLYTTYAALTGPSEKKIDSFEKQGINIDIPNYTLHFYIPNTPETLQHFSRYTKFYLQGLKTCWQIEAIDCISMPGIIEVYAHEYYSNVQEDDIVQGLVGDLIVDPIVEDNDNILGNIFIKPKQNYIYQYTGEDEGEWTWDTRLPIRAIKQQKEIQLKWDAMYGGQFELSFGNTVKTIVVESLF